MADYSIYTEIGLDTKSFDKGIKNAEGSLKGFEKSIGSLTKLLKGAFVVTGLSKLAKEIGQVSKAMAEATSEIAKGTGAIGDELKSLSKSVTNSMINGVGRSAQEIGSMVADLNTRFGATDKELEKLIQDFDAFSSVTGTGTKTAIKEVADVLGKWQVNTKKTPYFLDQLTVASQKTGASVDELLGGLKTGQSIFSKFGMNVTESIAFLGNLKKQGIDTSSAITGLRTALATWSKEGKNAEEEFKKISEQIKNAKTETEAMQIAVENFGSRSGAEMVRVLRTGSDSAEDLANALRNASGALKRTDEASRTSKDAFDDLKATVQGIVSSLGNVDESIKNIVDNIRIELAKIDLEKLKKGFEDFKDGIIIVFTAIGESVKTFGSIFTDVFTEIKDHYKKNDKDTETWKDNLYTILNAIYESFQITVETIKAIFKGDWKKVFLYGKLALLEFDKVVYDALSGIANYFEPFINDCIEWINKLIEKINIAREFFKQTKYELLEPFTGIDLNESLGINEALEDTKKKIEELTGKPATMPLKTLQQAKASLKDYTKAVKQTTTEVNTEVENTTGDIVSEVTGGITQSTNLFTNIIDTVKGILGTIKNVFEKFKNSVVGKVVDGIVKTVTKAVKAIAKVIMGIIDVVRATFGILKSLFQTAFSYFTQIIDVNLDSAIEKLLAFEDKVLTFFFETLPKLPAFVKDVFSSLSSMLETLLSGLDPELLTNYFKEMINNVVDELPRFVSNLLSFMNVLVSSVLNAFDIEQITDFIFDMITIIGNELPKLVNNLLAITKVLISALLDALGKWLESGGFEDFADHIIDAIVETLDWVIENLDEILSLLIKMTGKIIKALLEKLPDIIITVIKEIPDLLESIFSAIWDALKDMASGMGSFFSGIWDQTAKLIGIKGYAVGTEDAQRGLAIVGEQGPELVNFRGGEKVYNNTNTEKMLASSGKNIVNNITFNNTVDTTAYTMMRELKQYQRNLAFNGVL